MTDVFVIATGTSRPHIQALAERVEELLKLHGVDLPSATRDFPEAEWVLVDYGDFIVHLFQPVARDDRPPRMSWWMIHVWTGSFRPTRFWVQLTGWYPFRTSGL